MSNYRRTLSAGHTYFFTVNLAQRRGNDLLIKHIDSLREAFSKVRRYRPFVIHAIVILPDHLHCLWQLPENDSDYSTRWRLIKSEFSKRIIYGEDITASRLRKGERGLWQRRYWEHLIRDERDFVAHVKYIYNNPVKHGYVQQAADWPYCRVGCNPPNFTITDNGGV